MIQVLIIDDHPVVVEGLQKLFCQKGKKYSSTIAFSVADCLKVLKVFIPDIVLLDINLPDGNGIDLCKTILQLCPNAKIIALSSFSECSYISRMMNNGAKGYLLKNSTEEEIFEAIDEVLAGKVYLGFEVSDILKNVHQNQEHPILTRRETEVLKLIADGFTNPEIAEKLFISSQTVDSHRKNLLMKLDARNTAALVKIGITQGLIGDIDR
jgi:DNA-binding NarL/FixJ family response regulator